MKELAYQQTAIDKLVNETFELLSLKGSRHALVFEAPTGSGKTIMTSEMLCRLDEALRERPDAPYSEAAYIWIAPNKLHEQSYFKLSNYFSEICTLNPILFDDLDQTEGVQPGQILFVNWESINKEKNKLVKGGESSLSIFEIARITREERGVPIIVIIDEEHRFASKDAAKSENTLAMIQPKVEIRVSATPNPRNCPHVVVPRQKVIEEGMIKESIILNPAINFNNPHGNLNQHLLWLGIQKREELARAYASIGVNINPLLLIQLPNDDSATLTADDNAVKKDVMAALDAYGITVDNGKLAIWLSGEKTDNLQTIERPDDPTEALLFKEAIALGWDCPRAAVLVIFRKLGSFRFSVQTIGRILRMPEQKHYVKEPRLNRGYVYTNLAKEMVEIAKEDMDYLATYRKVTIRPEIKNIVLDSEYREQLSADRNRLGTDFKEVLKNMFVSEWVLNNGQPSLFTEDMLFGDEGESAAPADNSSIAYKNMQAAMTHIGINFSVKNVSVNVVRDLEMTGEVGQKLVQSKAAYVYNVEDLTQMFLTFCKRLLGNDFEQRSVKTLAGYLKEVMKDLFEVGDYDAMKIILFNNKEHQNCPKFERVIDKAIKRYAEMLCLRRMQAKNRDFRHYDWSIPDERDYPVDSYTPQPVIREHALLPFMRYNGARDPEIEFEKFLEGNAGAIDYWYKNGDQGKAHYSIGYINSRGERHLFYVDYIIRMRNGDIFLFDTKTKLSDEQAPYKHNALHEYMHSEANKGKRLRGGIIIQDKFGNWVYSPRPLDLKIGTSDTSDWIVFNPQLYV